MSWGFANAGPQATVGSELVEITTDALGFTAHGGETKLKLLPQPWPEDRLPPNTASLLSIASGKGLLAAAGPDCLVIASTHAIRKAYHADVEAQNNVKPFTPQATLSLPRVSQVAFSADETCLVITAEDGGGLAVYDVESLLQGNQQSAFQMSTNGTSVRVLLPNPAPEFAHLYAVVLTDGKLMVANLKEKSLGNVFREGVSCVSWSAKGKQLVAGLNDGSAVQYDPKGVEKAQIPKPPDVADPMTTICWVTNDEFLTIHTPVSGDTTDSIYHMMSREKSSGQFTAHRLSGDPCPAFGMPRNPAHHYIQRLRGWSPNLDEMFIISSTAAIDIGVITKASVSLAQDDGDMASDSSAGNYTTTSMANDAKRAQLPTTMGETMDDTSPIGMALDLSSNQPIPVPASDEMDESATPVPALMLLNNEGLLCTWWVVYNDSIQKRTAYPGLTVVSGGPTSAAQLPPTPSQPQQSAQSSAFGAPSTQPQQPAFGSPGFGKPAQSAFGAPAFGKPAASAFGSAAPAFGSSAAPGSFGGASALGAKSSVWGGAPAGGNAAGGFGKPAFGSASQIGGPSASSGGFGAASGLGSSSSPWGTPSNAKSTSGTTFGQQSTPFGGAAATASSGFAAVAAKADSTTPAFAAPGNEIKPSSSSPFSSFGNTQPAASPFAKVGGSDEKKPSPFSSFGQSSNKPSGIPQPGFGSNTTPSFPSSGSFGAASTINAKPSPWGTPAPTSKETTMAGDADKADSAKSSQETPKPTQPTSIFGQTSKPSQQSPFAQLDNKPKTTSVFGQSSDKPAEASKQSPFAQFGTNKTSPFSQQPSGSLFGQPSSSKPASSLFGKPSEGSTPFKLSSSFKADDSAKDDLPPSKDAGNSMFGSSFGNMLNDVAKDTSKEPATPIKPEPGTDERKLKDIPESSPKVAQNDEAPLPPDFATYKPKPVEEDLPPIAGSPPVDLGDNSQLSSPVSSMEGGDHSDEGEKEIDGPADEEYESWEDEDEEDDGQDEDEDDEEGEVHDDDEDDDEEDDEDDEEGPSQDDTISRPPKSAAASAFGSRLTFPSQATNGTAKFPVPSTTPAGLPKGPLFAPHAKPQQSPRSPSPVRLDVASNTPAAQPAPRPAASKPNTISVPSLKTQPPSRPSSTAQKQPPPPPEPEAGNLSDDEDARIQEILESEFEPTKSLEPFIAHQDYIGQVSKPGIGGQIEKVYRDINSMIDTLGLNARSLGAFVKGHENLYNDNGRERSHLEDPEDWCLIETEDLGVVEKELGETLESGKVDDVNGKIEELGDLLKDTAKLRSKTSEMRKTIVARTDPQQRANHHAAALNVEAQMQQTELRQGVAKVQGLLQEAEEMLSSLRVNLASVSSAAQGTKAQRAPTVEAVTNTILKMTAMIEQKSGDVDVLEAQIRRLPQGFAGLSLEDDNDFLRSSVRSLSASTRLSSFGTPPRGRGTAGSESLRMSGIFGSSRFQTPQAARKTKDMFGIAYTPDGSGDLSKSVRSLTGSARKKMSDVSQGEVKQYLAKQDQRRKVLNALKKTVEKRGTRITTVDKSTKVNRTGL